MKKPNNWESTQAYGDFEPLELGGHICKIMSVEETKSRNNKDMIVISLDIADGSQKDYYANLYKNDSRENKKWKGIVYQLIEDSDGNTNKGFKTFIESVAKSNKGFNVDAIWDDKFTTYFKGKLIGGIFGREQYEDKNGKLKWSTKCFNFTDIDTIKKGVEVPADKPLENNNSFSAPSGFTANNVDDDDLPF